MNDKKHETVADVATSEGLAEIIMNCIGGIVAAACRKDDSQEDQELLADLIVCATTAASSAAVIHILAQAASATKRGNLDEVRAFIHDAGQHYNETYNKFAGDAVNRFQALAALRNETTPTPANIKEKVSLETKPYHGIIRYWAVQKYQGTGEKVVLGTFVDHPDLRIRGRFTHTSAIVKLDREARTLETRNSRYTLENEIK